MFESIPPTPTGIHCIQRLRQRNYLTVELTEKLGPEFLDDAGQAVELLAESEEWLVAAGVQLDPLPSDDHVSYFAEVVKVFLDFEGPALLFGDVDAVSSDSAGETPKP